MLMNRTLLKLSLGLALLAGLGVQANAADVIYQNGMKDTISDVVPVPAPVPIPIYQPGYYFRLDAGLGFGDNPSASEQGLVYGRDGRRTFGSEKFGVDADFEDFVTLGVGVGAYFGGGWRGDITGEYRSQAKVKINGEREYYSIDGAGDINGQVLADVRDETTLRGGIFLANLYYDVPYSRSSWFKPYVGAGLGFAWNELKRNHFTDLYSRNCTTGPLDCPGNFALNSQDEVQDKTHTVSFAAQITTGFVYDITDGTSLDFNYRFLYLGGMDQGFEVEGNRRFGGNTKVSIDDTYEHQIRAGLRFDVN